MIFHASPFWTFSRLQTDELTLDSQGSLEILDIQAGRKKWDPESLAAVALLSRGKHACTKVLLKSITGWKDIQARHLQTLYSKSAQFQCWGLPLTQGILSAVIIPALKSPATSDDPWRPALTSNEL